MITASVLENVFEHYDGSFDDRLGRLFDLLRIPSISTDPAYASNCSDAANALCEELNTLGFKARVVDTDGHPIVLAHYKSQNSHAPHALFYGHYDVQPADPLELWDTDPFEPALVERADGRKAIFARGASDDKAQLRTFVEACRSWKEVSGDIPCDLTIMFEGEEETGSPSMKPFLNTYADELKADFALICDTSMWDKDTPAITISLRGLAEGDVIIKAADRDLHSGVYGSAARNPITLLTQILGRLHDGEGRVQLDGFYDDISEPSPEFLEQWSALDFDGRVFLQEVGLSIPAGEAGHTVLEQIWSRPTAEINGIIGGYTGEGFKTVIPAQASAKLSFRLVAGQDPVRIWSIFENYVRAQIPSDCTVEFIDRGGDRAMALPATHPVLQQCAKSLSEEWGRETVLMGTGGSIPIAGDIKNILGIESILVGFALDDDQIHSPNEKYELKSFEKGGRSWIRILGALGTK